MAVRQIKVKIMNLQEYDGKDPAKEIKEAPERGGATA